MDDLDKSLTLLRNDAIERGFQELAISLGWSLIRMRAEKLMRAMTDIERAGAPEIVISDRMVECGLCNFP